MSVNQGIAVTEVSLILIINENSSGKIIVLLISHMKILVIVSSPNYRIADPVQSLYINPADHICVNAS